MKVTSTGRFSADTLLKKEFTISLDYLKKLGPPRMTVPLHIKEVHFIPQSRRVTGACPLSLLSLLSMAIFMNV